MAVSPGPRGAAAARPRLQPRADVLDQRRQRVVRQAQARGPPHERHARNTHPRQLQDTGQHHFFTINYHYSMLSLKVTTSKMRVSGGILKPGRFCKGFSV